MLSLAFVFLLVGYGTKVGLVPLHNWLPDAHAEGPTPVSAVLSGLLLNVALYAVVRCKVLVEGAVQTTFANKLMMGFGLLSVVVAALLLSRQKDIKRLFAYSSIEHMGIITFAFGMGGPVANFAALLHMTVHSLTKSAIFFTVGHATQKTGTQVMDDIRGLITISPLVGWGLAIGSLAILGMPPFGVFASEFLMLTTAMREQPWATPFLLGALGLAFAAVFSKVQPMVVRRDDREAAAAASVDDSRLHASRPRADAGPVDSAVPRRLVPAGGAPHRVTTMNLSPLGLTAAAVPPRLPARRACRDRRAAPRRVPRASERKAGSSSRCGSPTSATARRGFCLRVVVARRRRPDRCSSTRCPEGASVSRPRRRSFRPRAACSAPRSTSSASPSDADDQRPWLWLASWPIDQFPLRRDFVAQDKWQPGEEEYAFVKVEGDGVHEIPVGPVHAGIIEPGHFRFQVVGEKVLRLEERLGWVHKGIEKRFESMSLVAGRAPRGTHFRRQHGRLRVRVRAGRRGDRGNCAVPPRAQWLRALLLERERIANHLGDLGYLGNDAGFAFGLAQFGRLKEDVLRTNLAAFGHRLLMDAIVPGGVARDLDARARRAHPRRMRDACEREVRIVREIYDEHAGVQDRFRTCGRVTPDLARTLGLTGLAGRASGAGRRPALRLPGRALRHARGAQDRGRRRRRRGARRGALRRSLRIAAPRARDPRRPARRAHRAPTSATRPSFAPAWASSKGGADRCSSR